MGSVYRRKNKLWIRYKGEDGKWTQSTTPFCPGQEKQAKALLKRVEERVAGAAEVADPLTGMVTIASFAEKWLDAREKQGISTARDDRSRLTKHVLPRIGDLPLGEVRPGQIKKLVQELRTKPVRLHPRKKETGKLAPRTVRNIYGVLRTMMADAVGDELIDSNPCQLRRKDLPKKVDKDPTWRATAVFTRREVEVLISDERTPEDRRTLYALIMLAGGLRFGEAAALRWRMYDAEIRPLGRLLLATSFNTHTGREKSLKTEVPRQVPVHPTLASVLARWRLTGWEAMMGRKPTADDLIVPSRTGRCRSANHGLKKFHQDLERLKLRKRRQHDLRRTFISLALGDGARKDILRWITHGSSGDIMDQYVTLPWEALCREMSKLKVGLLKGEVIALPKVAESRGADGGLATPFATPEPGHKKSQESQRLLAHKRGGVDGTRTVLNRFEKTQSVRAIRLHFAVSSRPCCHRTATFYSVLFRPVPQGHGSSVTVGGQRGVRLHCY